MWFLMAKKTGEEKRFAGYMGPQIWPHDLKGRHLFSMWDTAKPSESGRRLAIPASEPGSCTRNCNDCGLEDLRHFRAAGLTTGTKCISAYVEKVEGQAFVYRIRMSNATAEAQYDGTVYHGTEWEVEVLDLGKQTKFVLGRVLLQDDTGSEGIDTWKNFHEHIGCTPCDAFYEKTTIHGPFIINPSGLHTITAGYTHGLNAKYTCRLHREVALGDLGVQMETGPGVTPASGDTQKSKLFHCTQ